MVRKGDNTLNTTYEMLGDGEKSGRVGARTYCTTGADFAILRQELFELCGMFRERAHLGRYEWR